MRWVIQKTNDSYLTYISKKTGISKTLAQILINRDIKEPSQIKDFLNPSLSLLSDPLSMDGAGKAIERIKYAIKNKEKILVHGDYDADGLTATAIMVEGLRRFGGDVHYFIPSRQSHGYGFNEPGLRKALEVGAFLIITVDCGIKSFTTAIETKRHGIDLIITDHHLPHVEDGQPILPEALSVVNPKLKPANSWEGVSISSELSGAGVVFRLMEGLYGGIGDVMDLLDLATIGIVGDIVPLRGENRYIISEGLSILKASERPGIRALLEVSGMKDRELSPSNLSFTLVPRLNAPGRLAQPQEVVNLLLTDIDEEAWRLARWVDSLNRQRQNLEEEIYEQAQEIFRQKYEHIPDAIVLSREGWHIGVLGIIASRFQEEFYRPTFVFSIKDGIATGSARSIPELNIIKILNTLRRFFIRYGGHPQAAGLTLRASDLEAFEAELQKKIQEELRGERPVPTLKIDAEVGFRDINISLIKELNTLEPFGFGNEEPLLGAKEILPVDSRIVGNGHLKLRLRQNNNEFDVIGFGMAELLELTSGPVDIVFIPQINDFNGRKTIQLKVKALRRSANPLYLQA